ncbi:thioesterase II family protein [Streptomyces sp. WM6368]|uniref:thioesterase II family protein n=1 Tax=Streptomyces sp. WM6368 TaxID=1415554 RepID=UPI0006AEF909|nr:alpha/beta fold hydrolase [Streptomyces sp. WM6368]KOU18772.1 oleoyl-ACP hydrolase [Streptomyces sp. WM6368]
MTRTTLTPAAPRTTGDWLRRFHPAEDAPVRLFCFPHAGGSASYYFPMSRALSPDADVLAVQYPGRQDRRHEACIDDLRELADRVVAELRPWCDRPVALFGHSLGASLAFEVALRLQEAGDPAPVALFASGRRAPSHHRENQLVHLAPDDRLLAEIKALSGTDPAVLADDELLRSVLPAIRGDYKAAETYRYRPGPALACPITVLTGDIDPAVTAEEAAGWADHTGGPFALHRFAGGHFYLNQHGSEVIDLIRQQLT